jgi:probable HAF family extracellular repeat protein
VTAGFDSSYAYGINQAGHVAGYETNSAGGLHAFLWRNGAMTDLGTLGGAISYAFAVNDSDQVVGTSQTGALDANGNPIFHAFLWQNGAMKDLGALPGGVDSEGFGINNLGQVVGMAFTGEVDSYGNRINDPFVVQNGVMTDLGVPGFAWSINDAGQISGTTIDDSGTPVAFRWQGGTTTLLQNAWWIDWGGGFYNTYELPAGAGPVNASGTVVGSATVQAADPVTMWEDDGNGNLIPIYTYHQTNQAAEWLSGGTGLTLLDLPANYYSSWATGINTQGDVVGVADSHAVIWRGGGAMSDLTYEVPAGWTLDGAQAINDAGQIAGHANGHAVLLTHVPDVTINNVSVIEGNVGTTNAVFTVSLSTPSTTPVTVKYATADGTATAGSDYLATSGTLTFAPGETSKTITVKVIGDRIFESNETFTVNLSGASNANIAVGQGVGTILDDEPRISINSVSRYEGRSGQTLFTFTVALSNAYDQVVTVSYKTTDGTAKVSDHDYAAQTGTLTFNPGETTKTITIVVYGDSKRECDETFFVDLFGNSSNSLLDHARGTGYILNDD